MLIGVYLDMIPVTIPSNTGIWTRINRNHTEETLVIDYIIMNKKYKHEITYVGVDVKCKRCECTIRP